MVYVLLQTQIKYDMFVSQKNTLFTFLSREIQYRFLLKLISVFFNHFIAHCYVIIKRL